MREWARLCLSIFTYSSVNQNLNTLENKSYYEHWVWPLPLHSLVEMNLNSLKYKVITHRQTLKVRGSTYQYIIPFNTNLGTHLANLVFPLLQLEAYLETGCKALVNLSTCQSFEGKHTAFLEDFLTPRIKEILWFL